MPRSSTASKRRAQQRRRPPTTARAAAAATIVQPPAVTIQRAVLVAVVVIGGVVFWRATQDVFNLPRATLMVLAVLALLAVSVVRAVEQARLEVPRTPVLWILAAFSLAIVVATITAPNTADALIGPYHRYSGAVMYLAYAALFVFVLRAFDRESLDRLAWAGVAALAVATFYGLLQVLDADPFTWTDAELSTVFSTFGQINFAGGYVGMMFPLALWGVLGGDRPAWLQGACAALGLGVLWFALETGSFQAIVALAASTIVFLVALALEHRLWDRLPSRSSRVLAGVALAAVLLVGVVGALVSDRVESEIRLGSEERLLMWDAAGDMFGDQPLLGHGMAAYGLKFSQYRPIDHVEGYGLALADAPHDVPLDLAVSGGLLLLLPYLAFVGFIGWALVQGLRRLEGTSRLLLGAFGAVWAGYQVQSLVSIDVPPLASIHWLFAGAILVLARPPEVREIALPWRAARRTRRGGPQVSAGMRVVQVGAVVVALVVAWFVIRPLRADYLVDQAGEKTKQGNLEGAVDALDSATDLAPWEGTYWGAKATILQPAGRAAEALEAGQRAAEESPGTVQFLVTVARLARQQDQKDLALEWYGRAAERDPRNATILEETAQYHLAEAEGPPAVELLERAAELAPDRASIWVSLGQALDLAGRRDDATRAYERGLELDPTHVVAIEALEDPTRR